MEIYKITKGNFALENTRDIRPHENNLRFHIKIEEKYYEYAIDTINKKTINIRCVICKSKFKKKCYARLFLRSDGGKKWPLSMKPCKIYVKLSIISLNLKENLIYLNISDCSPDEMQSLINTMRIMMILKLYLNKNFHVIE